MLKVKFYFFIFFLHKSDFFRQLCKIRVWAVPFLTRLSTFYSKLHLAAKTAKANEFVIVIKPGMFRWMSKWMQMLSIIFFSSTYVVYTHIRHLPRRNWTKQLIKLLLWMSNLPLGYRYRAIYTTLLYETIS